MDAGAGGGGSPPEGDADAATADAGGDASLGSEDAGFDAGPGATGDAGGGCRPNPDEADEVCPEICPEQCNGEDDDCDLRIDERPAADGACVATHASALCRRGSCVITSCEDAFRDCDGEPANGCESSLDSVEHCGECDRLCLLEHAQATCEARQCVVANCEGGWDDCNEDGVGCETPLDTLSDCGGCGTRCGGLAQATPDCSAGACAIGTCLGNNDDCDGLSSNGCETVLDTLSNCGACDVTCALASCAGGVCSAIVCSDPEADCNADGVDCEVNLATDLLHCGGCNRPCEFTTATPNAMLSCAAKSCRVACDPGWDDCDENYATGCETAVNLPTRCGECEVDCNATLENTSATACDATNFTCEVVTCAAGSGDCDHVHMTGCEEDLLGIANCGGCASDGANEPCAALPHVATSTCGTGSCAIVTCDGGFDDCDGIVANGCENEIVVDGPCALRKKLTIDQGFVDSPLANFAVLVRVTDLDLTKARTDGLDIVFTDTGANVLDHELESWNDATGALIAWVRLPAVSESVNTEFYVYYGDGVARAPNANAAWDASFSAVYHLDAAATAEQSDSTANANHATPDTGNCANAAPVAQPSGAIASALTFGGHTCDRLVASDSASLDLTGELTISAWVRPTTGGVAASEALVAKRIRVSEEANYQVGLSSSHNMYFMWGWGEQNYPVIGSVPAATPAQNAWSHVVWTVQGSPKALSTYVNGARINSSNQNLSNSGSATGVQLALSANANPLFLGGNDQETDEVFYGSLDEVHVAAASRSAAWIKAEYENQRAGSTFLAVGVEQRAPPL